MASVGWKEKAKRAFRQREKHVLKTVIRSKVYLENRAMYKVGVGVVTMTGETNYTGS